MLKTDPSQLSSQLATYDNRLLDLSRTEARAGAKIVVWPEVGGYVLASDKAGFLERVETLTRQESIYLDMGLAVFQPPATYYDQAILVDPQGQVDWTYNKTYPAPGDPEKPGDGIVPVVATPYGHVANVICFDADFPGLMREEDSKGIDIMLVPSNDWQAIDPWHSQHAIFPAIENGYSLVRQASNGLAMTVDYQGHVLAATDSFTTDEQIMVASVPMKGIWTVYSAVGDLFAWLCIIGLLLLTGGVVWSARTGQKLASPVMEGDRPLILTGKGSAPLNN
jgi:apolipoprotein N-acyltransferase